MTHGFPLTINENRFGMLPTTLLLLDQRWKKGHYLPLATEAYGIYEIVIGSYFLFSNCKDWLKDYRNGTTSVGVLGITPKTLIICSIFSLADGILKVTPLICVAAGYCLASRSIAKL